MAKYITFNRVSDIDNKPAYEVKNKRGGGGYPLGFIEYCKKWKQYIFCSEGDMQFRVDCLEGIIEFIKGVS